MKMKVGSFAICFGALTMLLGSGATALAASSGAKPGTGSITAERLFRDIRADAVQIRSAASRWNNLAANQGAKWLDFDRQWNEIKPPVEDMQIKLARLETMQSSMSQDQRKEIDQSKLWIGAIQSRTHELRSLLDRPGISLRDLRFRSYSADVRKNANMLVKTVAVS